MNEKFFSLPEEKQQAIINAGYKVFSQNTYHNSPMREIAEMCIRDRLLRRCWLLWCFLLICRCLLLSVKSADT